MKSIWHKGSELPNPDKMCLYQFESGCVEVFEGSEWPNLNYLTRWAYIDDIK